MLSVFCNLNQTRRLGEWKIVIGYMYACDKLLVFNVRHKALYLVFNTFDFRKSVITTTHF